MLLNICNKTYIDVERYLSLYQCTRIKESINYTGESTTQIIYSLIQKCNS
jgi:hypothetical protein